MSEIVEQIRSWAQNEEMINQHFTEHGEDCMAAADEIERLQHDVNRLIATNTELATENERLQAALQEIASQGRPVEYDEEQRDSADYETGYDMCILTARQALQETKQ